MKLSERTHVPLLRGIREGLGDEHFIGRVEPFIISLETGADSGHQSMLSSGHEFVFCLHEQLEYQVDEQVYPMEPGDNLLFSEHLQHCWRNAGNAAANFLIVISNFSEGEKPTAIHMAKDNK
jgi:uncharacterized cupin superfamily protein